MDFKNLIQNYTGVDALIHQQQIIIGLLICIILLKIVAMLKGKV